LVEAAKKHNVVVMHGTQGRSSHKWLQAVAAMRKGIIGDVYMARALCYKNRDSIGIKEPKEPWDYLDWNLWQGPAQEKKFCENYVHYNWHWFWDYGCSDMGNQGPHQMDIARWGLKKAVHPKKIKCVGGYFAFDSDQESPNTQIATFEYEDGKIVQFEVRGVYTNSEEGILIGNFFYGTLGWMQINGNEWKTFFGRKNQPGPSYTNANEKSADPAVLAGAGSSPHFRNFIDTLRSGNWMELAADIEEGHMSTSMCHLGNISKRLGRELTFDSHSERFSGDDIADSYLTRNYRYPYVVKEQV
jgi:predicted dehydrogenase